ncbi:formylglycine-generating enzyme family protein [Patescibacteria group bacterium]|nr:formylglycine-generating enzyme family protein [Patescibacteria group bacterium]
MKQLRIIGVIMGALVITALGIDASDTWRGSQSTMLAQLIGSTNDGVCPDGMVEVATGRTFVCADQYEASALSDCPHPEPSRSLDTSSNIEAAACGIASVPGAVPWRSVARSDAQRLCARAGKRLPTAAEWYTLALDTKESACRTATGAVGKTGEASDCRSAAGVYDAVGNVWEWVEDDVVAGQFRDRPLPPSGYVAQADVSGVAIMTSDESAGNVYGTAYFWSEPQGNYGMIRGGFYGSRADAGVHAVHAHTPPEFTGEAIGFRCVR